MADILEELTTYLKTISAVTTLVGSGTAARIYTHEARQKVALPYVVFEIFEGNSHEHLGGISGVADNRIEIRVYGATKASSYTLAEAIRLAPLQSHRGTLGTTFVHEITSTGGYRRDKVDPFPGSNQARYAVSRDYIFTYEEAKTA